MGRATRGDVRAAVLLLLADDPMHGYQLMRTIAEKTGGRWTPSPGAIYPTLNQLEDEGLVLVTSQDGRRLATLTDAGREHVTAQRDTWSGVFPDTDGEAGTDLRSLVDGLRVATKHVAHAASEQQLSAVAEILTDARRRIYLVLADAPTTDAEADDADAPADAETLQEDA